MGLNPSPRRTITRRGDSPSIMFSRGAQAGRGPLQKTGTASGRSQEVRATGASLEGRGGDEKERTTDNLPYFPHKVSSFQDS